MAPFLFLYKNRLFAYLWILALSTRLSSGLQRFNGAFATKVQRDSVDQAGGPLGCHQVPVDAWLRTATRSLLAIGTYAGDFNTLEYAQCLRYYWPILHEACGVEQCALIINTTPQAARLVAGSLDLPESIELWVDNTGSVARRFDVSRGWIPDVNIHPFLKLLAMMPWGIGAPGTFEAIFKGYLGSPSEHHPWIQDAFAVGQMHGRWPSVLSIENGVVVHNKFDDFMWTGSWPVRPFEKATLRLQTMLGITFKHWDLVMPNAEALDHGVLTQLGGCLVVDKGRPLYEWRDTGCCAVANFEDIVATLSL